MIFNLFILSDGWAFYLSQKVKRNFVKHTFILPRNKDKTFGRFIHEIYTKIQTL